MEAYSKADGQILYTLYQAPLPVRVPTWRTFESKFSTATDLFFVDDLPCACEQEALIFLRPAFQGLRVKRDKEGREVRPSTAYRVAGVRAASHLVVCW